MHIRLLIAFLFLCVSFPVVAEAGMTVQQAYESGHYKRTPFDAARSKIKSQKDIQYLQRLFDVSDKVFLSRVLIMQGIYTGRDSNAVTYTMDMVALSEYFSDVEAPEHLQTVHQIMLELMDEQQIFLSRWAGSTRAEQRKIEKRYELQPAVQSSNRKVQQIYIELMKLYPEESEYNRRAFFDHLYALDLMN